MEGTGLANLLELLAQPPHTLADHAAVSLDLCLTGATEEAETTTLAFKVGPAAHEAALLIVEMRQFDLQPPFGRRRSFTEDFEDQPGSVDDLAFQLLFEIALLDRRKCAIDNDQLRLVLLAQGCDIRHLARAEQRVRTHIAHGNNRAFSDFDTDREGESYCLLKPLRGIEVIGLLADIRAHDKGARTARYLVHQMVVEAQSSSPSQSPDRSSGVAGWIVDTACL